MVSLVRSQDIPIDRTRMNFARAHNGVSAVFDKENNVYYNEKIISKKILELSTKINNIPEININK